MLTHCRGEHVRVRAESFECLGNLVNRFELAGRLRSRGIATVTTAGAAPRLTVRVAGNDRYTVEPAEESARLNTFDDLVRLLEDGR